MSGRLYHRDAANLPVPSCLDHAPGCADYLGLCSGMLCHRRTPSRAIHAYASSVDHAKRVVIASPFRKFFFRRSALSKAQHGTARTSDLVEASGLHIEGCTPVHAKATLLSAVTRLNELSVAVCQDLLAINTRFNQRSA